MYSGSGGESSASANQQILDGLLIGAGLNRSDGLDHAGNHLFFQPANARPPSDFSLGVAPLPTLESTATPGSSTTTTTTPRRGPRQSVCLRCRRSKLRCDRQWPCLHCRRHQVACEYPGEAGVVATLSGGAKRRRSGAKRESAHEDGVDAGIFIPVRPDSQPRLAWSDRLGWRDHLLSCLGVDRVHAQRQIVSLLRRVPKWIYDDHFYHFVHMSAPIKAIIRPDEPTDVHPALMYAMVAYGLRMSNTSPPTGLIPREGVPVIEDGNHPANILQREAEVMLTQTLSDQNVGLEHSLAIALASAMVMKLQPELSERIMHYRDLSLALTQTPLFRQYTDGISDQVQGITFTGKLGDVANESFRRRASVQQEEAARVRLLTLWSSFRQGYVYANVEVLRGRFKREDWHGATVFAPFVDEPDVRYRTPTSPAIDEKAPPERADDLHYDIGAEDRSGMMGTVTFKARALNSIWRCASSWQVKTLNYARPEAAFEDILQQIDQGDQSIVMLQQSMVNNRTTSLLHKTYFAKRVVAIAFLQGFLIRRIGFAHCAALRKHVAHALNGGRGNSDRDLKEGMPVYERPFDSPSFQAFLHLMNTFLDELENDFEVHHSSSTPAATPPRISHFSLDSVSLYAAASQQYSDGVAQAYAILGHPDPASQAMARALRDVSNALRLKVNRHRTAHMQCGNPRRILERAVLLEC